MRQQVNLYQARFKPTRRIFSAQTVLRVWVAAMALLTLLTGHAQWRTWNATRHLESVREQQAEAARRVVELAESHPPIEKDTQLDERVRRLTAERDAKTQLLRLLANKSLGNVTGFSEHLAGLARQRVQGLWLREIQVRRGGGELALVGSALAPELVPRLIQELSREAAFVGSEFKSFRMQRSESEARKIDFALDTEEESTP